MSLRNEFTRYCSMDVYGFNSAKFDLVVLAPYLIPLLKGRYPKSFNSIKKGSLYFTVSTECFTFKDAMLFGCPMTLSAFLKQAEIKEEKSIWPYEYFHAVDEITECHSFPPYEAFYSNLKGENIDYALYQREKTIYETRKLEKPDLTMLDWLKRYNLLDVTPFAKAIEVQFKVFFKAFAVDPSLCNSLPKFAMICLFNMYAKNSPKSCELFYLCVRARILLLRQP
jgi:hypothetical protein